MKNILNALKDWREERRLTIEGQRDGFVKNFSEEYSEYAEKPNKFSRVDALCDMFIVIANSDYTRFEFNPDFGVGAFRRLFTGTRIKPSDYLKAFVDCDLPVWGNLDEDARIKNGSLICAVIFVMIDDLGFEPLGAIGEAIKEISSRTGAWDDAQKKWVKFQTPEAKSKWYKAKYSNCKKAIIL